MDKSFFGCSAIRNGETRNEKNFSICEQNLILNKNLRSRTCSFFIIWHFLATRLWNANFFVRPPGNGVYINCIFVLSQSVSFVCSIYLMFFIIWHFLATRLWNANFFVRPPGNGVYINCIFVLSQSVSFVCSIYL